MIYVRLGKAYSFDDIYTPVIVTGRMSIDGAVKALSYVDGEAKVSAGYSLTGEKIELYRD